MAFASDFKRMFMKGLAALLPTVVTIAILVWAFNWINDHVAAPITDAIISVLPDPDKVPRFFHKPFFETDPEEDALVYGQPINELDPETGRRLTIEYLQITHPANRHADPEIQADAQRRRGQAVWHIAFTKWKLNIIGFIIAIVLVYIIGYFISGLLGRTTWRIAESILLRVPLIRSVYPNIKQVTDFLIGDRQLEFAGVVAVQYPRNGIWSLGLLTGRGLKTVNQKHGRGEMMTVFIPSSPTPITGYTIMVDKEDVIELSLTIDEALRFCISGGVIRPPREGGLPEMAMQDIELRSRLSEKSDEPQKPRSGPS